MTKSPESWDKSVMSVSVSPSLKYSCSGSLLILVKGKTAMDGLSGNGKADASSNRGDSWRDTGG
jgi:hypothetical protein